MSFKFNIFIILFLFLSCSPGGSGSVNFGKVSDFEEPCAGGSQCESKQCIETEDGPVCTQYCSDDLSCPEGYFCSWDPSLHSTEDSTELGDNDMIGFCRPVHNDTICKSCSNDEQCDMIGGHCKDVGERTYCLLDCMIDECPSGFSCSTLGDGFDYCIPDTDDCTCTILTEGRKVGCSLSNEFGECPGTKTCYGDNGWSGCEGQMPGPEVCDGEDNNCDGNIDEGLLGTVEHCSMCFDACEGSGNPGTVPVCDEGVCGLECQDNYYDTNDNTQDGCECQDDSEAPHCIEDTVSLGGWTDCDFTYQHVTSKIPGDLNNTAPPDYFKFNYDNVWNCQENLQVSLKIISSGVAHRFCVSGGNNTNESTWECKAVSPGTEASISPYDNDGNYYIKVELLNQGTPNCTPYQLTIKDN
ncbi:MAG: hypothetical protein ACQES9_00970 [Myxococcota bacterium]